MPDRLLVDLGVDGRVSVGTWLEGGLPVAGEPRELGWPLDDEALEDLRWYLEDYLRSPFGAWEDRGPRVESALAGWGQAVFSSVFGTGPARDAYIALRARRRPVEVVFRSASPGFLGLPWELMADPAKATPLALDLAGLNRSLPVQVSAEAIAVPEGRLRVLMVISRPAGTGDVGYRMIARPLLERLEAVRGQVDLVVLRPPTLEALKEALAAAKINGKPFQVVHFDGHGVLAGPRPAGAAAPLAFAGPGPEGVLVFEKPAGGPDEVPSSRLAQVLAAAEVPVVVLNACQSGAVGKDLEAAVATRLLGAGVASVVAMAYTVYAVAAAEFMAAFYERLFAGGTVTAAVTAGRERLYLRNRRPCPKGELPLADWLVPVHYLHRDVSFPQARTERAWDLPPLDHLLDQQRAADAAAAGTGDLDQVGPFVGRDDLFFQLEVAARLQKVIVLHGPGGTGKTELAKAFGRWWRDTGGVDRPDWVFWHSFEPGVASFGLDGVITEIGLRLYGTDFAGLQSPQRRRALQDVLAERRMLLIWDNFETVRSMPDPGGATGPLDDANCAELRDFLTHVAGHGNSAVLITSRTREDWLSDVRRIALGGLAKHEAVEYAENLLAPYPSAAPRRARRAFGELMEWLDGHPLSMRLILPRLDTADPEALLAALRGITPLPPADVAGEDRTTSLSASVSYSFAHLSESTRRLLPAVSLFHAVADVDVLEAFSTAPEVPERFRGATVQDWIGALDDAARVGLLTRLGRGMYRILPALPGYLGNWWRGEEPDDHDAVREAATWALVYAHAAFGDWLKQQIRSGHAGLAHMVIELECRTMSNLLGYALDQGLWREAQFIAQPLNDHWNARGWYEEARAWVDRVRLATEDADGNPPGWDTSGGEWDTSASALWAFFTSSQAGRDRERRHFDDAERSYEQLLAVYQAQPPSAEQQKDLAAMYNNLGMVSLDRGLLERAEDRFRKAQAILEEVDDKPGMADGYFQLGKVAQARWRLEEAEKWYRKSLAIREELRNMPWLAVTYHQLGMVAGFRGRRDEEERWYLRSLAIEEELGNKPGLAESYEAIGGVAMHQGRLDAAENWYQKALTLREDLGDRPGMSHTYRFIGMVAQLRGRWDEAEEWYLRSLALGEEFGDKTSMSRTFMQLAWLADNRGQLVRSLEWAVRCVALFSEFPPPATGPVPDHIAALAAQLGTGVLEQCWQQVTGDSLPEAVRRFVETSQVEGNAR